MKILVFCPTYHNEPDSLQSIWNMDMGAHEVRYLYTRTQPCDIGPYNILYNYRRGRDAMLAGDYDAMMTVEDDMIIPQDALVKLADIEADIASGLYVNRHRTFTRQTYVSCIREAEDKPQRIISDVPGFVAGNWGKVAPVISSGLGCAFIHRHVLEAYQFRISVLKNKIIVADCDSFFYDDAAIHGFSVKLDLSIICGHISQGVVYWPNRKGGISTTLSTLTRQLLETA